ncbi:fibronectin type III domain-containing protein [Oceanicoccus sagamiensis]|uniref:Fibronectin type-III domain-containing protein n=1 Tax=Oceanicoccus sagamiensis TaxID=716816 RepID=A0A1X9NDA7_9GAMM|nr:fibronectin type III domain-containing protein [Oceanicoccus sagamiensis]ARN74382.1 hypothetical protein BST96_09760 [Oceanicoccus sagamiensis]
MNIFNYLVIVLLVCSQTTMAAKGGGRGGKTTASPHTITVPADMSVEATTPQGIAVSYAIIALDGNGNTTGYNCTPTSGSLFPVGNQTVSCTTEGKKQLRATDSFVVAVTEPSQPISPPPELQLPADITVEASSTSGGAIVEFITSALPENLNVSCLPSSGSEFNIGSTAVECTTSDSEGRTATGSFQVTVNSLPIQEPPVEEPGPSTSSLTVSWAAPSTRENGEPLSAAEILGYEVYMLAEFSGVDTIIEINENSTLSTVIENLQDDTYHFSISAIDSDGLSSQPSDIMTVVVQTP